MLSIILPAYNEEKNIDKAIEEISKFVGEHNLPSEIIVVNDGSRDGTKEILNNCTKKYKNLIIVNHSENLGYGAALRSGFAKTKGDLIFFTDSDLQFNINGLSSFMEKTKDYDFVVGYRKKRQDPLFRRICAMIFKTLAFFFFSVKVRDVNCAFKLFKAEVIKNLPLSSSGALINLEIFALAKKKGYKFLELPVEHFSRQAGRQTGGNFKIMFKAIMGFFPLWRKIKKIKL